MFESWFNYRYVAVSFSPTSNVYYYKASSLLIGAGDVVIVPTTDGNVPALVLGANTYSGKEVPYPVRKTKDIIGKADNSVKKQFLAEYKVAAKSVPHNMRHKGELVRSYWIKKDRLIEKPYHVCGYCKAAFIFAPPACPQCHDEMRKTTYDPVWIDELEFLEGY